MRARNRNLQKNQGSPSQRRKKKKNEARKSAPRRNQNLPIRNESEPSAHCFWAEGSDKRVSAQYLRPNLQPIYQVNSMVCTASGAGGFDAVDGSLSYLSCTE